MLNRRKLLSLAASAGVASVGSGAMSASAPQEVVTLRPDSAETLRDSEIIDTNVSLFQWPFHRLPFDNVDALSLKLRSLGIVQAWSGNFEGVLHRDISAANQRLADVCGQHQFFIPIGSVNPELPDWSRDLRQCVEIYRMPGIRLHPNYHGYTLNDSRFRELLKQATTARVLVQIVIAMEDTRTQHPQLQVSDVDPAPLVDLLRTMPDVRVQLLNYQPRSPLVEKLAAIPGLYFDTARIDGTDAIPKLVQNSGPGRVLFGSHAPFLIPEAALIRVHESDILDDGTLQAVYFDNANNVLAGSNA